VPEHHDDVVRNSFARQRDVFSGADSPFATRDATTRSWLEPLSGDMVVLDVACGAGHAAELAAPHVRQVVGIDLTRTLLELGADRLAASGITNVLLQEGNAAALPFVDASFDLVFCRTALHHMTDPEPALAEMARVCRAGGRVVVEDMTAPSADVRDHFDDLHRALDPSHTHVLVDEELFDVMRRHVGPVESSQQSTVTYPFASPGVADAVMQSLQAEIDGGRPTGFRPVAEANRIRVTFTHTAVHARKSVSP
jgi:ubiquinone/menaquinone biosynthesis C-methylase UbiE